MYCLLAHIESCLNHPYTFHYAATIQRHDISFSYFVFKSNPQMSYRDKPEKLRKMHIESLYGGLAKFHLW